MDNEAYLQELADRLHKAALPDPYDEREVMCAPEMREAAAALRFQIKLLAEHEDTECYDNERHAVGQDCYIRTDNTKAWCLWCIAEADKIKWEKER